MELQFIEQAYNEIQSEIEILTDGTPTATVVALSKNNGGVLVDYLGQVFYGILDDNEAVSVNDVVLVGESSKVPVHAESLEMSVGILGHNALDISKVDKTKMEQLNLLTETLEKLNTILTEPSFRNEN